MHPAALVALVLLAVALALVLVFYFAIIHTSYRLHRFYASHTSVPVAPFLPAGGHVPELKKFIAAHNTLGCWRKHLAQYGPVHAMNLGNNLALKVDDPYYLRGILRTDTAYYHKSAMTRAYMVPTTGPQNLLLLNGDEHTRHRHMINPG